MSVYEHMMINTNNPDEVMRRIEANNRKEGDHFHTKDGIGFYASKEVEHGGVWLMSFNYGWIPASVMLELLKPVCPFQYAVYVIESDLIFEGDYLEWRQFAKDNPPGRIE